MGRVGAVGYEAAPVPVRVAQYVQAVIERMRFNAAHDLPLTMGQSPSAFLAWVGLPARTAEQENREPRRLIGGNSERQERRRAYQRTWKAARGKRSRSCQSAWNALQQE